MLKPFKFHGEIPAAPSPAELAGLEAAARRRSTRCKSPQQMRAEAVVAQAASGVRIRIYRPVENQRDFAAALKAWYPAAVEGSAVRNNLGKSPGALALTLFDTAQQPLRAIDESATEESVTDKLHRVRPTLFRTTGRIAVSGTDRFGSDREPFVALVFGPSVLNKDRQTVRETVAPELMLGDSHLPQHRLHLSLGRVLVGGAARADEMQELLAPALPQHVEFGPVRVMVENRQHA